MVTIDGNTTAAHMAHAVQFAPEDCTGCGACIHNWHLAYKKQLSTKSTKYTNEIRKICN